MRRLSSKGTSDSNRSLKGGNKERKKKRVLNLGSCGYSYGFALLSGYTKKGKDLERESKQTTPAQYEITPKNKAD